MATPTLLAPCELWERLQSDAGLELRLESGKPGRDADLDTAVLAKLAAPMGPASSKTVGAMLRSDARSKAPRITVEALLTAVLTSQRGFAAMMQYILQTLVIAQGTVPEHALSIEFKFDSVTGPIRQTLEEFRATVEKTERVLTNMGFELPKSAIRWNLWRALQGLMLSDPGKRKSRFNLPQIPPTGYDQLDELLAELSAMVGIFQAACLRYGDSRSEVIRTVRDLFPDGRDPEQERQQGLARDASDYWDADVISSLHEIANAVVGGKVDAEEMVKKLNEVLSALPHRHEWVSRTYSAVLDILNLPIWRKRNELYSVWVGSMLLRAATRCASDLRFHPVNGVLSFSFTGKRLATYDWSGVQFDIWCELRSALVGPSKTRKKGIQPDFRVVESTINKPITQATRFVLECKHYLSYSLANFSAAANDYARSCPNASVFIVNHGPADHDLLIESVDPGVASKVAFHGDVTADCRIRPHPMESAIERVLFPTPPTASAQANAVPVGETASLDPSRPSIKLFWTKALEDLDLALEIFDGDGQLIDRIDFRNKYGASTPPLAGLLADQLSGPGVEVIEIYKWEHVSYEVNVTNYSKIGEMRPGTVHCLVTIDGRDARIDPPTRVTSSYSWRVARIDVATKRVDPLSS